MFPYECPPGVTHWTLWSRREMSPAQIVRWTKTWLRAHKPNVTKWNFDMNDNNSVGVPRYHVFLFEPPRGAVVATRTKPTTSPSLGARMRNIHHTQKTQTREKTRNEVKRREKRLERRPRSGTRRRNPRSDTRKRAGRSTAVP